MPKRKVKQFLALGDKISVNIIKGNLNNPVVGDKFEFIVNGEFKDMSNNATLKSLEKLVKDLTLTVNNGFAKVNSRLDVVEKDIKDIKSCPTIQKELKLLENNQKKIK